MDDRFLGEILVVEQYRHPIGALCVQKLLSKRHRHDQGLVIGGGVAGVIDIFHAEVHCIGLTFEGAAKDHAFVSLGEAERLGEVLGDRNARFVIGGENAGAIVREPLAEYGQILGSDGVANEDRGGVAVAEQAAGRKPWTDGDKPRQVFQGVLDLHLILGVEDVVFGSDVAEIKVPGLGDGQMTELLAMDCLL